jgi:hypothetical protein
MSASTLANARPASGDVSYLWAHSTLDQLSPDHRVTITVEARSAQGITAVRATLHHLTSTAPPFAVVENFALTAGTAQDGTWEAAYPLAIEDHPGRVFVGIEAVDDAGSSRTYLNSFNSCYKSSFTEFTASPATIDIDHSEVTVRGRLTYLTSAASDPRPVAGATVWRFADADSKITTDSEGRFAITVRDMPRIIIQALASGPVCVYGRDANVTVNRQATRLSAAIVTPQPVTPGAQVTVEGKVIREAATGLPPAVDVPIHAYLDLDSETSVVVLASDVPTRSDGTFSLSFAAPHSGTVTIIANETGFLEGDRTDIGQLDARYRTSISGFDAAPEPVGKGSTLTLTGKLGVTGQPVSFYFRRYGSTTWTYKGRATTDQSGAFRTSYVADVDGTWEARYAGDATHLPTTASDYVDVKYRTSISSFNAAPEPVAKGKTITVSGKLNRYVSAWGPLGGKTVYIYFRPYGATAWSYMGVATSDKFGTWHRGFKASRDGTWYAKYKGSDTYLPVTSGGDYVDVR